MNLGTTRTAIWTTPPTNVAEEVEDSKFVFGSCTTAGSGRYWACIRDFNAWYKEEFGKSNEDARKSDDEQVRIEANRLYSNANDYGAIMASLRSVSTRTRSLAGADDTQPPDWKEIAAPAEWDTFEGFSEHVPWSLLLELAEAAHACNPGVWRFQDSESAKKKGGVNAG